MVPLKKYRSKRDFTKTIEPSGTKKIVHKTKKPLFVIQKHAARALHYDLRLEIDGVLVSWAVPKGPSLNPRIKRLAVMTEDHPRAYAKFEGVIPEGEYGGGPVIIWDTGLYTNIRTVNGSVVPMKKSLKQGLIEVFLEGKKLYGGYVLVRTDKKTEEKSRWILIKKRDQYADGRKNPVTCQPESVISGKTIEEVDKLSKRTKKKK